MGDRHLFARSRGEDGRPTLDIIDYKRARFDSQGHLYGQPIDRIIYMRPHS